MIYLTGENVFTFNSGTEFSQFKRLEAFTEQGWKTKLLLRNYNRMLAKDVATHALESTPILNMYDYFQETVGLPRKERPLRLLKSMALQDYHIVGVDNNTSELRYQGRLLGKVNVMPETIGLVGSIEYFDTLGHTMVKEYWDWRGFLSLVETYHPDGSVATKQFLRCDGSVALEVTHMYLNGKVRPTSYKLLEYHGKNYLFDTEDQLYTFFLNEINAREPGIFISDRRTLDQCVANVVGAKKKIAYIHSVPFADLKKKARGILPIYQTALFTENFDRVVFPTKALAKDLCQTFKLKLKTATALDSWFTPSLKAKTLGAQKTLVYVGRLAEDKNIVALLKCFKVMFASDQTLRFKLQGYFSDLDYQKKVEQAVQEYKLDQVVSFLSYAPQVELYQEATLFLNASTSEGFGMNMLESMAHGVPVVSYALEYTTGNLLKNSVNGVVVNNKTPNLLAKKALALLQAAEEYQKLSSGALETAKQHDKATFIATWAPLVQTDR